MGSATTSGTLSGAAQGAAYGTMIAPGVGTAVGAVVGGVFGFLGGSAADRSQRQRQKWLKYHNEMKLQTNFYNLEVGRMAAEMNAQAHFVRAKAETAILRRNVEFNAGVIAATSQYNDSLLQQEIENVWAALDLDLTQLEHYKNREKGAIIAKQAVSGTVIGEGSNEDVLVSQAAMRALDASVIKHNADKRVANITNKRAQNAWQGQVALSQQAWQGQMSAMRANANAAITGGTILTEGALKYNAGQFTALQEYKMGEAGVAMDQAQFDTNQTQALVNGLFSAGATYASYKYDQRAPGTSLVG